MLAGESSGHGAGKEWPEQPQGQVVLSQEVPHNLSLQLCPEKATWWGLSRFSEAGKGPPRAWGGFLFSSVCA